MVLKEEVFDYKKNITIDDFDLPVGFNDLVVEYILEDGETLTQFFKILNTSEDNLGKLDSNDSDEDGIINYLEEAFGTNKDKKDTDDDGISDYDELAITKTDPTKAISEDGSINDAVFDSDGDGLSNKEELLYGTDPTVIDTDGDGLSDYEEIVTYHTDALKQDSDGDSFSDYEEVKNYHSNPNEITEKVSGMYEYNDIKVEINNLSSDEIKKLKINEARFSLINDASSGFLSNPYSIDESLGDVKVEFKYDGNKTRANVNPTVYKINEDNTMTEVPSVRNNDTISTTVNGKNIYVLYDKNAFEEVRNNAVTGNTKYEISETTDENNEYFMLDIPLFRVLFSFLDIDLSKFGKSTIYCVGKCKEEYMVNSTNLINDRMDLDKNVVSNGLFEMKKMPGVFVPIFRALQDMFIFIVDPFMESDLVEGHKYDDGSFYKVYAQLIYIFDLKDECKLESFLFGDTSCNMGLTSIKKVIDMTDEKDSNNDGLSDSITRMIAAGQLTTETGFNPFEGLAFSKINKNDDFDGDGLKNGEEVTVVEKDGKLFLVMKSDPTKVDSDGDGLSDKDDRYPLVARNGCFEIISDFNKEPKDVVNDLKKVENANALFGKGKMSNPLAPVGYIEYTDIDGVVKRSDYNIGIDAFSYAMTLGSYAGAVTRLYPDAGVALLKFYYGNGERYTENNLSLVKDKSAIMLTQSSDYRYYFEENVNLLIDYIKQDNSSTSYVVESHRPFTGTDGTTYDKYFIDNDYDFNTAMFLHWSKSEMIAKVERVGDKANIKLRYFIEDTYDWDRDKWIEVNFFNDILLGNGKAFNILLEFDYDITYDYSTERYTIVGPMDKRIKK